MLAYHHKLKKAYAPPEYQNKGKSHSPSISTPPQGAGIIAWLSKRPQELLPLFIQKIDKHNQT